MIRKETNEQPTNELIIQCVRSVKLNVNSKIQFATATSRAFPAE